MMLGLICDMPPVEDMAVAFYREQKYIFNF